MSSSWTDRFRKAIGLRLAAWYLGTFLISTVLIGVFTYTLLAQSLEARDRDLIQSTLREYAARYQSGGFQALADAVDLSQLEETGTNDVWRRVPAPGRNAALEVATLGLGNGTVLQVGKTTENR